MVPGEPHPDNGLVACGPVPKKTVSFLVGSWEVQTMDIRYSPAREACPADGDGSPFAKTTLGLRLSYGLEYDDAPRPVLLFMRVEENLPARLTDDSTSPRPASKSEKRRRATDIRGRT